MNEIPPLFSDGRFMKRNCRNLALLFTVYRSRGGGESLRGLEV